MITNFGKGEILKGSDCEIAVVFSTCKQHIDIEQVENFTCDIYTTPGGAAITRSLEDFEIDGEVGITLLQWEELDQLEDGVLRYTLNFDYEGEHIVREMSTMYYLKTPIDYTPKDFVTMDEIEGIVASAITSSASTELIEGLVDEAVSAATSGMATEEYVQGFVDEAVSAATSGMATEEYVQGIVSALPIDSCVLKVNADATQLATSDEEIRRFYDALDRGELNRCYITTSSNPPSRWSSIWDSNRLYTGDSTFGDSSGYTFNFYFRLQDNERYLVQGYLGYFFNYPSIRHWVIFGTKWDDLGSYNGMTIDVVLSGSTPVITHLESAPVSGGSGHAERFGWIAAACGRLDHLLLNKNNNLAHYIFRVRVDNGVFTETFDIMDLESVEYLNESQINTSFIFKYDNREYRIAIGYVHDENGADYWYEINRYSATPYTLPTASSSRLGGIKVGSGLTIDGGKLSVSDDYPTDVDVEEMISAATQNFITSADTQAFITSADTQDFLTSADTRDFITSADTSNFAIALTSVNKIWGGSAQAYSALTSYDNDTIYFVDPV